MKKAVLIFLVLFLSAGAIAQKPLPGKQRGTASTAAVKPTPKILTEKEQFEAASALELAPERISALQKFLTDFPESGNRIPAQELIASSRVLIAEEKLLAGDPAGAAETFKLVVEEGPKPYTKQFFNESIAKIPSTLFWRGSRPVAFEIAGLIEKNAADNPAQLLELANFYISIENGSEALRVAQAAIALDANSASAYQTLALAHRVNFDLEESAAAYAKAVELDPGSVNAKRGLADLKRALGKPGEAVAIYRELLAANENDPPARSGLILALFDEGNQTEAESELAKSLEQNPSNVILLAGAAYWYASHNNGDKAIELAQKAIEKEPRYVWSHIALARGHMAKKDPVAAERVLIKARTYGNFPTLEYEIASARLAAGFFREAAEGIEKSFVVNDGIVQAKLGGRVSRSASSFSDLVSYERKASIFAPVGADSAETAEQLKRLVELTQKLNNAEPNEAEIATAAEAFAAGDDNMRLHRQLYAANALLQKKVALPTVLELAKAATGNTDTGLDVANANSAVMASELYESRVIASARGEFLLVPEVPKQTLSAIMRGRVEEITGWTLYQQDNYPAAVVRLRRAVSVLPANSAWWRSSLWRLGAAQEASGQDKEALSSYVESFRSDKPDFARYAIIEALYKRINGSVEGLDVLLGRTSAPVVAASTATPAEQAPPPSTPAATPAPEPKSEIITKPETVPVRIPRSVPVAVEPAKTETAAVPVPAQVTETVEKTPAAAEPTRVETAVDSAENGEVKQQAEEKEPEAVVKTDDTAMAEPAPTVAPPVEEVKTEEKRSETPPPAPDVPVVKTESVPVVETKVEPKEVLPQPDPVKEQTAEPPTEVMRDDPPPPPATMKPVETAEPSVEIKREDPPPGPAAKTEVKISPTTNVKKEDDPPPVRLRVERTSNLALDKETPPSVKPTQSARKTSPESGRAAANKPIFEPIIIPLPKRSSEEKKTSIFEPVVITIPKKDSEELRQDNPEDVPVPAEEKLGDAGNSSGATRPRVVVSDDSSNDSLAVPRPTCSVTSSQDRISLINDGGSVGILIGLKGNGDVDEIEAISSSPGDVEVITEPEIGGVADQRFYVIRSISRKLGVFQVTFKAECGSKEVVVIVR